MKVSERFVVILIRFLNVKLSFHVSNANAESLKAGIENETFSKTS